MTETGDALTPSDETMRPDGETRNAKWLARQRSDRGPEAELEELREAVLDDWLAVTSDVTGIVRDIQQTLSWRVTKPLRTARIVQKKVSEVGIVPTGQLVLGVARRRLGR